MHLDSDGELALSIPVCNRSRMNGLGAHAATGQHLGEPVAQLGGQHVGERHELGGLVRGVAKHVALVTGANLLQSLCAEAMHALANIWRLLLNVYQDLSAKGVDFKHCQK